MRGVLAMGLTLVLAMGLALVLAMGLAPAAHAAPLTNRLASEASPFLRAHAADPIAWQPHGEDAFRAAAALGRPLFVSIGYATCSGCLRMSAESFSDREVAEALNAGFVPVLVDREAAPELADAYAATAAAMGEAVGYPLHLFLLPDGSPFHVARYLPRHDRPESPGIVTVLASVTRAVAAGRDALARRGAQLRAAVARELAVATPSPAVGPGAAELSAAVAALLSDADPEWGGRLALPKRPLDPSVPLLLRYQRRSGDRAARAIALRGLRRMAPAPVRGADGGFHEAAAARDWSAPHAEQRLADNARLAIAYLEAWQVSGHDPHHEVSRSVLDFLLAQLAGPEGGFFAVRSGAAADDTQPAGANGLALSALARAAFVWAEPRYLEAARRCARFALTRLDGPAGLAAFVAARRRGPPATLQDYALLTAGLLDLLEAEAEAAWLEAALRLQAEQETRFAHPEGGYFLTQAPPGPDLPRPRHARDGALPSGQGVAASNLLRLHALTGAAAYRDRADAILRIFQEGLRREPRRHVALALALDAQRDGLHEVVLALAPGDAGAELLAPLRRIFAPNRVLLVVAAPGPSPALAARAPLLAGKRPLGGESTAFVCRDHVCAEPARDARTLARQLERFTPLAGG